MNLSKRLFITDKLIITYVIFCMVWIGFGYDSIDSPFTLFLQYCGVLVYIALLVILQHYMKNPLIRFIRYLYPLTLLGFFFTSATAMDLVIFKEYLDPYFQYLDHLLLGYQPVIVWGTTFDSFFVQEFFHFAYFSYYLLIFGVPFYIYLKYGKAEYIRVLFNILFVFFTCYVVFMILPVVGGRFFEDAKEWTETFRHGLFTHTMAYVYQNSTHWGGAFPSSHVAIAFTITLLSFRYFKFLSWLFLINTFFLSISTIFCHYHYLIDVLGGIIFGFTMFGISEFFYALIGRNKEKYIEIYDRK